MSWPGGVQRYDRGGSAGEGAAEILGGEDFGVGTEGEKCLGGLRRAEAQLDPPFAKDFRGIDHLTVDNGRITHVISLFDLSPVIRAGGAPQHGPPPGAPGGAGLRGTTGRDVTEAGLMLRDGMRTLGVSATERM